MVCRVHLGADETLLLVTDGVTEARDVHGHFYAVADDVRRSVAADPRLTAPAPLVMLVRDGTVRHCRGHLTDDTTVFAVRRTHVTRSGRPAGATALPTGADPTAGVERREGGRSPL